MTYATPKPVNDATSPLPARAEARNPENAIYLDKTDLIEKLVKQGQILGTEGKYYLSDEGIIVANGTLNLYPELKELGKKIWYPNNNEAITELVQEYVRRKEEEPKKP